MLASGVRIDILPTSSNVLVQLGEGAKSTAGHEIVTATELDRDT